MSPPMSAGCRPRCSRPSASSTGCTGRASPGAPRDRPRSAGATPMPVMKKSQYRWQMTEPVPATSAITGCNPTGRSSVLWETLRELPVSRRDLRLPAVAETDVLSALNLLINNDKFHLQDEPMIRFPQGPAALFCPSRCWRVSRTGLRRRTRRRQTRCRSRPPGRRGPAQGRPERPRHARRLEPLDHRPGARPRW